jgi:hypothetical protein
VQLYEGVLPLKRNIAKRIKKGVFDLAAVAHKLFEFTQHREKNYGG